MRIQYIFSLGELFERVQMENIFSDNKTFVDCTPKSSLDSIEEQFQQQKNSPGFDLAAFVHEHFLVPEKVSADFKTEKGATINQHIEKLWDVLTRSQKESNNSLIPLPQSYVVPGGRFRELFYWDSYFTMLGLKISNRMELFRNMVDDFACLIDKLGYIPNGNRTYFLGRSQPPFFSSMLQLLAEVDGKEVLLKYLPQLKKEHSFWMEGKKDVSSQMPFVKHLAYLTGDRVLNHYWDQSDTPRPEAYKHEVGLAKHVQDKRKLFRNLRAACESGWDFSSRWYGEKNDFASTHATDLIAVDLNCLLVHLEETLGEALELSGEKTEAEKYLELADARKIAIDDFCWNQAAGFYFDYDAAAGKQNDRATLAAAFPLFFKIASEEKADAVANTLKQKFLRGGGVVTTLENTGQQWDAPNGWAPLEWITVKGLANYGHNGLAAEIGKRWLLLNEKVYKHTGKLMEKYNVENTDLLAGGGEYQTQDGFGWTNGVYLAIEALLKDL